MWGLERATKRARALTRRGSTKSGAPAPYFYDGRAQTIRDVLDAFGHGNTTGLSAADLDDLTEYVNSL